MIKLTVKSKIPANFGQWINFEASTNDRFADIISRICHVSQIQSDEKMYLRMENGEEIVNGAKVAFYMNTRQLRAPLELHTKCISKTRWICAFLGLFLGILALILSIWGFYDLKPVGDNVDKFTSILIDAGSSHTRGVIYEWTDFENVNETFSYEEDFALDQFIDDLGALETVLRAFLLKLNTGLESNTSDTRVYLGATAGLRLLNISDWNVVNEILNVTKVTIGNLGVTKTQTMQTHFFFYLGNNTNWNMVPGSIRVLSGQEEALFGWISTLHYENEQSFSGSLDMGGASAQKVNFCKSSKKLEEESSILQLFQEDFSVTASSALCYGLEEAIKRFVALLIYGSYRRKTLESQPVISNPCLSPRYYRKKKVLIFFFFFEWNRRGSSEARTESV